MNPEIVKFWKLNNTPIELMVHIGNHKRGLARNQIEEAAKRVYEEAQEILEDTSEPTPFHSERAVEKIVLARNKLHPSRLGWRVYEVAKTVPCEVKKIIGSEVIVARLDAIEARLNRTFGQKLINWSKYSRWE